MIRRMYALSAAAVRWPESERNLPGYFDACERLRQARWREDIATFRSHLAPAISAVSPIVMQLVHGGLDLDAAVNAIDPPPPSARRSRSLWSTLAGQARYEPARDEPYRAFRNRHRLLGTVIRSPDDPLGRLGIRFRAGCIDAEVGLGDHVLWTRGTTAHLMIDAVIPMALALALPGRSLGQLCSHPLLAETYRVTKVVQHPQGWTVVSFRTGTLPCGVEVRRGRLSVCLGPPSQDGAITIA